MFQKIKVMLRILRPFLECYKEDLQTFLEEKQIQWVEDPSNNDEKYLRNKIRKFLNSFDNKQEILSRINSAVENINESKLSINSLIKNIEKKNFNYWDSKRADRLLRDYVYALSHHYNEDEILHDLQTEANRLIRHSRCWSEWRTTMESWTNDINSWSN